jgi:hypothetical protein
LTFRQHSLDVSHRGGGSFRYAKVTGRVAVEYLEGSSTQRRMLAGVVPVLGQRNPLDPLAGARINEAPKKCLEALVDALSLAI